MKAVWMPCPRCNGSGFILVGKPHQSQPERETCQICEEAHWANDLRCIAVIVPDTSHLPMMDSMGRQACTNTNAK